MLGSQEVLPDSGQDCPIGRLLGVRCMQGNSTVKDNS